MRYRYLLALLTMALTVSALAANCGPSQPAATPTSAVPTMGQLAQSGQALFAVRCSKCHGEKGEGFTGPTIIGSNARLGKYNTAQGLRDFIGISMPLDAPGSLSNEQYHQLLCFVLLQNNLVSSGTPFSPDQLGTISLK